MHVPHLCTPKTELMQHPVELRCSWEAVLVVMDSEPFRDMYRILQDLDDDRIWVFAEWVRPS